MKYKDCLPITVFFYDNGCPMDLFLDFIKAIRVSTVTLKKLEKFKGLWIWLERCIQERRMDVLKKRTYYDLILLRVVDLCPEV